MSISKRHFEVGVYPFQGLTVLVGLVEGRGRGWDKKLSSWSGPQTPHLEDQTCSFEVSEAGMTRGNLVVSKIPLEQ